MFYLQRIGYLLKTIFCNLGRYKFLAIDERYKTLMFEKISLAENNSLKTLRVNFAQSLQVLLEASYVVAILNTNSS